MQCPAKLGAIVVLAGLNLDVLGNNRSESFVMHATAAREEGSRILLLMELYLLRPSVGAAADQGFNVLTNRKPWTKSRSPALAGSRYAERRPGAR